MGPLSVWKTDSKDITAPRLLLVSTPSTSKPSSQQPYLQTSSQYLIVSIWTKVHPVAWVVVMLCVYERQGGLSQSDWSVSQKCKSSRRRAVMSLLSVFQTERGRSWSYTLG